tara:strand:+ start:1520 stop:2932 length:1413 start_codon:yes stop_codon:yes gene_type:complete
MALKSNGVTQVPDGLGSANQVLKVNSAGTAGEWGSIATTDNTKLPLAGGTMTGDINFGDNDKAIFGAGSDLQIHSDGTHSYITESNPSGNFYIRAESFNVGRQANSELYITAFPNGAVNLYHDNAIKLATTSTGIDVTGNVSVSGTVDGVDIAARDAILTSTTTTAGAALPKAGGTMTGDLLIQKAEPIINLRRSDNDLMPGLRWQGSGGAQAASIKMDGDSGTTNSLVMSTYNGSSVTERLRILTNAAHGIQVTGNVGIGTSSPSVDLHIASTGSPQFRIQDNDQTNDWTTIGHNNGLTSISSRKNAASGSIAFRGINSNAEFMRIIANGNVGIGTATPATALEVNGAISAKVHHELFTVGTIASNIVSLDLNTGTSVVTVASPGANFSLAITNALNTGNTTTGLAIIVTQSPSPFIPNALTVNGSAVTINWLGGSAPAGTGSKTEIFSFTLINTGGVFIALGSVSTFG